MAHGRKSKSRTINGFKKHLAVDMDNGLILAAAVKPANQREYAAEPAIRKDVERLGTVEELHADRGYLSGTWLAELHGEGKVAISKAWQRRGTRFGKGDFTYDFDENTATCPNGETAPIRHPPSGRAASFPVATCRACPMRNDCLPEDALRGRTVSLHPQEQLLQDLRTLSKSSEGRAKQRERVVVEHRLAHHCRRQGRRARYIGVRKNTLDARRVAAVENLHVAQRLAA